MNVLMIPAGGIDPVDQPGKADTLPRLEAGLEAWASGRFHYILVCGGIFLPQNIQTRAAADIMADWLVEHGIRRVAIITEDRSVDTFENVNFGIAALQRVGIEKPTISVCSHALHAVRTCISLDAHEIATDTNRCANYSISWKILLMEIGFVLYHWLDPLGKGWLARRNCAKRRQVAQS